MHWLFFCGKTCEQMKPCFNPHQTYISTPAMLATECTDWNKLFLTATCLPVIFYTISTYIHNLYQNKDYSATTTQQASRKSNPKPKNSSFFHPTTTTMTVLNNTIRTASRAVSRRTYAQGQDYMEGDSSNSSSRGTSSCKYYCNDDDWMVVGGFRTIPFYTCSAVRPSVVKGWDEGVNKLKTVTLECIAVHWFYAIETTML